LVITGVVYYAIKPTPPEKLFAAIEKAQTPEAKLEAATKFLEEHGDKGGEMVDKAAAVFREGKVRERENQLINRHNRNLPPTETDDPEAYNAALAALDFEKVGELDLAASQWTKVKNRFPEAKLPFTTNDDQLVKARWGWLGEKRLADLSTAKTEYARLRKRIEDAKPIELPLKTDPNNPTPESLAIRAIRLKAFGDPDKAARDCEKLMGMTERESDKRAWFLLASYVKGPTKPGDAVQARLDNLARRLAPIRKEAEALAKEPERAADRRDVRNKCREIVELYEDETEPGVKQAVKDAQDFAAMVPKAKQ
jgi:hypothetical protein